MTIVGVAAALLMGVAMFVTRRAQAAREQGFGDSLQDQLRRRIAQLGDQATRERRLARVIVVTGSICGIAMGVAGQGVSDVANRED